MIQARRIGKTLQAINTIMRILIEERGWVAMSKALFEKLKVAMPDLEFETQECTTTERPHMIYNDWSEPIMAIPRDKKDTDFLMVKVKEPA